MRVGDMRDEKRRSRVEIERGEMRRGEIRRDERRGEWGTRQLRDK